MIPLIGGLLLFLLLRSDQGFELLKLASESGEAAFQLCLGVIFVSGALLSLHQAEGSPPHVSAQSAIRRGRASLPLVAVVAAYLLAGPLDFLPIIALVTLSWLLCLLIAERIAIARVSPLAAAWPYRKYFAPLLFVGIGAFPKALAGPMGSLGSMLIILALYYALAVRLARHRRAKYIVITLGISFLLTATLWRGNAIRETTHPNGNLVVTCPAPQPIPGLVSFDEALRCWYESQGTEDATMVLVAAAGGGLRAALWTYTVLSKLDVNVPGFSKHLFALTGASGGAVGVTMFRAALTSAERNANCAVTTPESSPKVEAVFGSDLLALPLTTMFTTDVISLFFGPFSLIQDDRAAALELSFEAAWTSQFGNSLLSESYLDLWPCRPWPALLLNSTSVQTGTAVFSSNMLLDDFDLYSHYMDLPVAGWRASTMMVNTARFPIVSPAGRFLMSVYRDDHGIERIVPLLATEPAPPNAYRKLVTTVVDGGYSDNFGATAVQRIVDNIDGWQCKYLISKSPSQAGSSCREILEKSRFIRYVIIQVTSDPAVASSCDEAPRDPHVGMIWSDSDPPDLLTPFEGLVSFARQSGFSVAQGLKGRIETMNQFDARDRTFGYFQRGDKLFPTPYFHFSLGRRRTESDIQQSAAPLHWSLSPSTQAAIRNTIDVCGPSVIPTLSEMLKIGLALDRNTHRDPGR